jgi:YkoY family integral membrane protein
MLLHQTFDPADLGTVGLLVLLEGSLSLDNALVLGLLASGLPPAKGRRALAFGLVGAFIFRLVAVLLATFLLRWPSVKLIGAVYLIYLSARHFLFPAKSRKTFAARPAGFWWTVARIEITDLFFAVDNILAAVALIGPPPASWPADWVHPKLWVVLAGGMIGLVLTRMAAAAGIGLFSRFPRLGGAAYAILLLVACKLLTQWIMGTAAPDFESPHGAAFWVFWCGLAGCLAWGCRKPRR